MKITERRLRTIIRSVIKESMESLMPKDFENQIYFALQGNNSELINSLRKEAESKGYTDFDDKLNKLQDELNGPGNYYSF